MSVRGWVYVISNAAMPGLLKVGYSTKDPKLRAGELNNTGAPHPYEVVYDTLVVNPREIEQRAHSEMRDKRVGKEWFKCSPDYAVAVIRRICSGIQITESPYTSTPSLVEPRVKIRCGFCGESSEHPDSHIVYCPRCKRSTWTR